MTREQIIEMLENLIQELDYDIYKEMFIVSEDPDFIEDHIERLVDIVEEHFEKASNE